MTDTTTTAAELDTLLAKHSAFRNLAVLRVSVDQHGYTPTVSPRERGLEGRELRRLRVLLTEVGVPVFPDPTRRELEDLGVLRPRRSDPPALLEAPEVGQPYRQHLNQGTRHGYVIATHGSRYVAEYAMPAGRIFLRLGDTASGIEGPVSLARLPAWAEGAERLLEDELED